VQGREEGEEKRGPAMEGYSGTTQKDHEVRLPRPTKVKNKTPADRQVNATPHLISASCIPLALDHPLPLI
jgi:hypothetical protein